MSTGTLNVGSRTALTTSALNSLASGAYVNAGTVTAINTGKVPLDMLIEVEVTPGVVASPFQVAVFVQRSVDNSSFETGPTSGTTTTDEPNLVYVGVVPCNTDSTLQRAMFSLAQALGVVPPYFKVICKNETGAALASSGHAVYYTALTGDMS